MFTSETFFSHFQTLCCYRRVENTFGRWAHARGTLSQPIIIGKLIRSLVY